MMTNMENILKFSGSCELSPEVAEKLKFQQDFTVTLTGEVRAVTDIPNDDGTNKKIFRLRVSEIKEII